ncbi:Metallo-dependent phosphatase [Marasmius fiardii PR-910]|nr:Metallo-dependent phosphatase [Marasmius fiardii PR-910]
MTGRFGRKTLKNALRSAWVLITLWLELGTFYNAQKACIWPDAGFPKGSNLTHVLVVADPQILDHRSYPDRSALLQYLTQVIVDLNLRKNWRSALRSRPDVVFFLGDMMDGGRVDMSDSEYEGYYRRFLSIFKLNEEIPRYTIPGNHDIGLGSQSWFSSKAYQRYTSHFGPLDFDVTIGNHTFVLLNGPGLVEEDYKRHGRGIGYNEWNPDPGGTIDFVKTFSKKEQEQPVILLNHIPLSRPEGSYCGPLRERGTIRRGVGIGYQNTLGKDSSRFLLESINPVLVLSGDDHDYCDYIHVLFTSGRTIQTREVTVKSLSMAMGIRHPGYQMLSLASGEGMKPEFMDVPCIMPDQIGIYLSGYIPLMVLSILVTLTYHVFQRMFSSKRLRPLASRQRSRSAEKAYSRRRPVRLRMVGSSEGSYFPAALEDEEGGYSAPLSMRATGTRKPPNSRDRGDSTSSCRNVSSCTTSTLLFLRRGTILGDFLRDVRDVAVFPLTVLFVLSLWIMTDS